MSRIRVVRMPAAWKNAGVVEGEIRQGVAEGLLAAGLHGRGETVKSIRSATPRPPIDTGLLMNGLGVEVVAAPGVGVGMAAEIMPSPATMDRAVVMEMGRRPGAKMPPLAAIRAWVERKGLAPRGDAEGVAFAIARSIARKGIAARRFFARAIPAIRARAPQLVSAAVILRLRRAFGSLPA